MKQITIFSCSQLNNGHTVYLAISE